MLPQEIIVVDQSDSDETRVALEKLGNPLVQHIPSSQRGLSNARNTGIKACTSELIGFVDDDCIPARNWVAAAIAAAREFADSAILIGDVYDEIGEISDDVVAALEPFIIPFVVKAIRGSWGRQAVTLSFDARHSIA